VVAAITANSAFFVGGQFSQPAYEQLLLSQGLSSQRFEYEQRQSMEVTQFIEGLGYTSFYTPAEFRRYIELDGESRDLEFVLFEVSARVAEATVSEEEIQSFYAGNQQLFLSQESVELVYLEIDYEDIADTIVIQEADAAAYYQANPDEFRGPDERLASHILIAIGDDEAAAEQLADDLSERVSAGESFDDLAVEYSADTGSAGNGGSLGWLGSGDSPAAEFEEALFLLAESEVSPAVRTDYGFHLIRLDGIRAGNAQEYVDVKVQLMDRLGDDAAADQFGELVDELDDLALESIDGLQPVAESMGLELGRVTEFTRSGGLPLGYSPQLVDIVFSLEVLEDGENSPVIDLGDGRAVVAQVVEYRAPETRPLAEVRSEIEAQLRRDAAVIKAATAGQVLLSELNAGADTAVDWEQLTDFRRGGSDLPADLAAEVFRAPKPEQLDTPGYRGLGLASGDFAVYRVVTAKPGRPELYTVEDRDERKDQLANRLGGGQATAVVEDIVNEASIRVTPGLVNPDSGLL
jgi:peptidyl-prolyl cis-trans isomerase D